MNDKQLALAKAIAKYEAQGYIVRTEEVSLNKIKGIYEVRGYQVIAIKGIYEVRESYNKNGQKKYIHNYKNNKYHGKAEGWFEDGQNHYISNFKNGKLDGEQKRWYTNRQLWHICNYKDGKIDGLLFEWNKDGTPDPTELWENGKFIKNI